MKRPALFVTLGVVILCVIVGVVLWSKHQSSLALPSIVESISPANRASGVKLEARVTINFRSAIWPSILTAAPSGEPLSLNSTELADRFRITNAGTGETVRGTISIEDGAKLTFELPAGERWRPNSTYWIEGAANVSLVETYEEGDWQDLFLSAFTTQDLNADRFPVHHPIAGSWPTLLNDVAYDVDRSTVLSFDELKTWIETAPDEAEGTLLTRFHFWPNIIDLTEIYYGEDDHALFTSIIDQLLETEPDKAQLKSRLAVQVARGDRVFCARDFITRLTYGFKNYWEVHYGLLINLDNPDQAGAHNPYVREILVHEFSDQGLPLLHDPHIEELDAVFAGSTAVPLGKSWDLCLRGNLKNTKYNAIVVDRLAEGPQAEFYIERVELTCGCDFFSDLDTSIPDVPGKPRKPPPHPDPKPVWERQPFPNLPRNPHGPGRPQPPPGKPPIEPPWPFPVDPFPLPDESTDADPTIDEEAQHSERCEGPEVGCSDLPAVTSGLETLKSELQTARAQRRQERNTFERFRYQYGWSVGLDQVEFNDPCLTELLEDLRGDIAPLLDEIDQIAGDMRALWQQLKDKRDSMGGDPVLQAFSRRDGLWSLLFEFRGEGSQLWRELTEGCPIFIPSGGGVLSIGKKTLGVKVPQAVFVDLDVQGRFQEEIQRQMMNGATWQEAVDAAVRREDVYPEGYRQQDPVFATIWQGYADCLKRLHTNQLEIALTQVFGDSLTPEQLNQMINVMFNGTSALTEEQKKRYDEIQAELEELKRQIDEEAAARKQLFDDLDQKRQDFQAKAWRCCLLKSRESILSLFQQQLILEAYLKWCEDPEGEEALPLIPVYAAEYLHPTEYDEAGLPITAVDDPAYCDSAAQRRFCAVLCRIRDAEEFDDPAGLRAYARWLMNCNCGVPCDELGEPCDPECEDCGEEVQPPTPSSETAECAESLGYDLGFEDCLDGMFLDVDTGDYVEFMEYRLDDFLAGPIPDIGARECAMDLTEFLDGAVASDREWVASIFVDSYLEAQETWRSEMPGTDVLAAGVEAVAESILDESGCYSTLTISFSGQDLTEGSYAVTSVVLKVNGAVWHNSGTISVTYYEHSVTKEVGCGEPFDIEVIATNQYGLTASASESIGTPTP